MCRRCGRFHSFQEYVESKFCRNCGTWLSRRTSLGAGFEKKPRGRGLVEKFFPYPKFRPFQKKAIRLAYDIIKDGKIGLLSSPCGTGKSISVLTAFFMARQTDSVGRLLALTRTRNQLEIYSRELKRIKEHSDVDFAASIFKSKREMCPYLKEKPRLKEFTYREFLYYCKNLKEGTFGHTCECYDRTYRRWRPTWRAKNIVKKIKTTGPLLPDEVCDVCRDSKLCPHEVTKILSREAEIVVGNYNYILVQPVRRAILGRMGARMDMINCVFDEAHALPYYAAGILSDELSTTSISRAEREAETFNVEDRGLLQELFDALHRLGEATYQRFGYDEEHLIKRREVLDALRKKMGIKAEELPEIISRLSEEGEKIRRRRAERGKRPISYLARCAFFFTDWIGTVEACYAHYVKAVRGRRNERHAKIGVKCLDPSIAARVLNRLRSVILMSGTLWHTDYYTDVLGIQRDRSQTLELPSPFPPENRLILVDKSVTTKFERRGEEQWRKIANHLQHIIEAIEGRVAVYFPSYEVMEAVLKHVKIDIPLLAEKRDTRVVDVLKFLKSKAQCVVFGVARGKISEGVDMSVGGRTLLSAVVIVGLPYPKKTELQNALLQYFREKFGKQARKYANDVPCVNAMAQSAGRLLRSPEDRGIIVIMDRRATGRFKNRLPKEWREEMEAHLRIEKLTEKIHSFWATK